MTPRSSRIAYVDVDNDSLSSGDESDDADESTDDASSESEWSGDGDEDSFASSGPWPYTASYVKLVPHYKVAPGLLWDSPLVTLDAVSTCAPLSCSRNPHALPDPKFIQTRGRGTPSFAKAGADHRHSEVVLTSRRVRRHRAYNYTVPDR